MRSIWSGFLSFGLINIPIHLYSGSIKTPIDLDMLHKKDLSPIRYAKICKLEEKEVPYQEIIKGYEYEEGKYVEITDKDFESISSKKSETIDIQLFTSEKEINTIFYEKPYFIEPGKGGKNPYLLLKEALKKSGKVAIAKFIMRNHVHIGIIKIFEETLILNQIRYKSELRTTKDLDLPKKEKVEKKEVDLAIKLIEQLTETFKPESFLDTYTKDLQVVINNKLKKTKKQAPAKKTEKKENYRAVDLFKKLKESLNKRKKTTPSTKYKRAS